MKTVLRWMGVVACFCAVGRCWAAAQGTVTEGVYTITVGSGERLTLNADDVAVLGTGTGDVTELQKSGEGTLVATGLAKYAGTIRVSGGVYEVPGTVGVPFGTTAGKTIVEAGGTILFTGVTGSTTQYTPSFSEPFELAGTGCGGIGALCIAAENTPVNNRISLTDVTLTADVLVTGPKINDGTRGGEKNSNFFYMTSGTLNMGGHTLETRCTGNTEFGNVTIKNPGHFIHSGAGQFYLNSAAKFTHGPEHKIYMRSASALSFYNNALPNGFNWTVVCEGSDTVTQTTLYFDKGPVTFGGAIEIPEGKTCYLQANIVLKMTGAISGKGSLKTSSSDLYLAGDNSFEGTLSGGTVYVCSATAVPDFSKCTSGIAGICLTSAAEGIGMTTADFTDFASGAGAAWLSGSSSTATFYVPEGEVVALDEDYTAWTKSTLYNKSNGTVHFTKTVDSAKNMSFVHTGSAGGFRFSNPDKGESKIGPWTLSQGRMELFDAVITKSNNTFTCSGQSSAPTWLVISNSLVWGASYGNSTKKVGPFYMGNGNALDTIEILKGSVVTNALTMGARAGAQSALYLRDGFFDVIKNYNGDCAIGESGTGYFEQSGGACEIRNHCHLGHYPGSYGLHYLSDGTCKVTGETYNIGQSGNAVFYQNGGTFSTPYLFYIGSSAYDSQAGAAKAQYLKHVWTLEGEGATASCTSGIRMSERNNTEDTINLNDGARLTVASIYRSRGYANNNKGILPTGGFYTNDFAYVNFNGGTLRATASSFLGGSVTFSGRGTTSSRVMPKVYAGGATIEVCGYLSLSTSLTDATGKGVKAIPMPDAAVTTGRTVPPYVNIVGDGSNATAVATFDSKTGTWTGFRVTSPGFDYTWAKAQVYDKGQLLHEIDCELADNATGPVHIVIDRKAASNSELNFNSAQTYTGPTRISGGRLWFNTYGSLASRDITIDADANLCTAACVNGANVHGSGSVYYSWHTAAFTADGAATGLSQVSNTLTVDENPTFKLVNLEMTGDVVNDQVIPVFHKSTGTIAGTANLADATFEGLPEGYHARARYKDDSIVVAVSRNRGLVLTVQ